MSLFTSVFGRTRKTRSVQATSQYRFAPRVEHLAERLAPAVLAVFNTDTLTVTGDGAANEINVSADAAGVVRVFNGTAEVPIQAFAGTPTRDALRSVFVDARGGNDRIVLDRSLNTRDADGKLVTAPNATLLGGGGNDTIAPLIGGFVGGVIGNAIVGNVVMDGGDGADFLDSGFGNDVMIGGSGNDTLRWLPGTLLDVFEGGSGNDTAIVVGNGNNQGDAFVLAIDPATGRALFQRTNLVPFRIDIGTTETVVMQTGSGNDSITVGNLAGTGVVRVTGEGGDGDDTLSSAGANRGLAVTFRGGNGNDTVTGGAGNDLLLGDDGDDVLVGGDGNDTVAGGAGNDDLSGGNGTDTLSGDDGDDRLDGGRDGKQDVLIGGAGADTFVRYQTRIGFDEVLLDLCEDEGDVIELG